ncbi:hypothetical protein [Plantactinospora sp. GCM10030261]|uniref:hypothetical protein n=1 Tax=Plantactinospora sp. GCM10030261 TaxID=3273420 RepID=UPI003616AF12
MLLLLVGCASADPESSAPTPNPSGQVATDGSATPTASVPATRLPGTPATPPSQASPAPKPSGSRAVPAGVRIEVTRSGGFAGLAETVVVEPNGQWARDGSGARSTGWLTATERSRLTALLSDPRLGREAGDHLREGCADTYRWTLAAGSVKVTYDECLPPGDRPAATVAVVTYVIETAA